MAYGDTYVSFSCARLPEESTPLMRLSRTYESVCDFSHRRRTFRISFERIERVRFIVLFRYAAIRKSRFMCFSFGTYRTRLYVADAIVERLDISAAVALRAGGRHIARHDFSNAENRLNGVICLCLLLRLGCGGIRSTNG